MPGRQQRQIDILTAALDYASRGWPVHPLVAGTKNRPTGKWRHNGTTEPGPIREWFGDGNPRGYNILIATGFARLIVIDTDNPSAELLHRSLGMPLTRTVRTPRGGRHYYYVVPEGMPVPSNTASHFGKAKLHGFDIRGEGGYVVAPPSYLTQSDSQTAGDYTLEHDLPVAELRADVAQRLAKIDTQIPVADQLITLLNASEGSRNDTLNRVAFNFGVLVKRGLAHQDIVTEYMEEAAEIIGLPPIETRNTIRSGLASGLEKAGNVVPLAQRRTTPQVAPQATPQATEHDSNSMIVLGRDGSISKAESNILGILSEQPEWHGVFGYSTFHHRVSWALDGPREFPGVARPVAGELLREEHLAYVQAALAAGYGHSWGKTAIHEAIQAVARQHPCHELQDYLNGLVWDGEYRVDGLFSFAFGIATTDYERDVARWSLIGAVARALDPGCQMDTMLVLAGLQGAKKTTFCQILAGEWFLSSLPDLHDKDAVQVLAGKWIVEIGEMDAFRGKANSAIKDFLTRREDTFRPSYGRMTQTRKRSITFMGTTNKDSFLSDPTGNRRFLPVKIDRGAMLDDAWLIANRDQLWAEAVRRYRNGEEWWPMRATEIERAEERQDDAAERDVWTDAFADWLRHRENEDVSIAQVLTQAVSLEARLQDDRAQKRAASVLRNLGWYRCRPRAGGDRKRVYRKRD